MSVPDKKIGFIGGGNMAEAIIAGLIRRKTVPPGEILVSDKEPVRKDYLFRHYDVRTAPSNAECVQRCGTVVLAVKPAVLPETAEELRGALTPDHLIVSILAGQSRERIASLLGRPERVVRVMPNLPMQVGRGISAITFPPELGADEREWVRTILRSAGETVEVEENLQDAVTAISGSGPGYLFYLAGHFIDAAVALGLDPATARTLVTETMAGAAEVLRERGESPPELVRKVATPGGTTEAGLSALREAGLDGILLEMAKRAERRSKELNRG